MATTKGILIDRVLDLLGGGDANTRVRASRDSVINNLNSVLSTLLKTQVYEGFKEGMSVPDGTMIATYPDIPVDRRDNGRCSAALPINPVVIPGGIGVFAVYPSGYPEKQYVPISAGLAYTVTENKLFANKLGRRLYTHHNRRINFYDDVIGAGVTHVDMDLCILDIASLEEYDILPVPPDIEYQAIVSVLQLYGIQYPIERAEQKSASPNKIDMS